MVNQKLTDMEIVKALECCRSHMYLCSDVQCKPKALSDALDLIRSQKAEIERLKGSTIVNSIMERQKIKREAKVEAYKDFAERLKNKIIDTPFGINCTVDMVDNLLKEMTGGEE